MAYNIADLFEHVVDVVPDRTALVVGDRRLTFGEIEDRSNRLAHWFAARGIGQGDHIGIHAQNCPEWVVAMMAAFKLRAVPININFRYVADELAYLFDNADLVALVHGAEYTSRIAAVRGAVPGLRTFVVIDDGSGEDASELGSVPFEEAVSAGRPGRAVADRSPDDHYVLYTGGTTGMPKGVVWRHEDVFFALGGGLDAFTGEPVGSEHELAERARASEAPLVTLCVPPLMHGAAQWATMRFWFEGNTVVFLQRFDPTEVWATIERERCSAAMITGDAMGRPMIEALERERDRFDLSCFAAVSSSAAVFSPAVKDRFLDLLPDILIIDAIGSSESGHTGSASMGKGGTEMRGGGPTVTAGRGAVVLDDGLRPLPPGTGAVGRLARSGYIPLGYHKDPAKTARTFVEAPDGTRYVITGDFATLEPDGSITLLGRGSVCINSGGEKVFPEEVEATLKSHPKVFDAIVVGVPDARWGQTVAAVVQPRAGMAAPTLDELDTHCRSHIAGYKVPRHLHLVDEIVRSPAGKPDYPWAARLAAGA
jgi:acyl-CoA synthetase (AMP-forming)/AMP-acid ligase II